MAKFLLLLFLVSGSALAAKLPSIPGVRQGRDRFQGLSQNFLASYLPPVADFPCLPHTEFSTEYVTSTSTYTERPLLGGNVVAVTSTRVVPTTVVRGSVSVTTDIRIVTSTHTTTLYNTEFLTQTVTRPGQTRTVTSTDIDHSTRVNYVTLTNTEYSTAVNFVTISQTVTDTVRTTYQNTQTVFSTVERVETIPGETRRITVTETDREVVTRTIPGQTYTRTETDVQIQYQTKTEQINLPAETVYSTRYSTIFSTYLATDYKQEIDYVDNLVYSTRISTSQYYYTQLLTSTVTRSQVITSTVPQVVYSTRVVTSIVNQGRPTTSTVRIPAETNYVTVTRTRTTTVGGGFGTSIQYITQTRTEVTYVTRTVGAFDQTREVTVTSTIPCAGPTGYNYNEPDVAFNIRG